MSKLVEATKSLAASLDRLEAFYRRDRPASAPPPPPAEPLTPERIAEVKSMVLRNHSILTLLQLNGVSPHEIGRMFDAARGKK